MRSPLGDQKGERLREASLVKRVSVPRLRSRIQRSAPPLDSRENATDFSSGERAGWRPDMPTGPRDLPVRSNQPIWDCPPADPPAAYSSTPLSETVAGRCPKGLNGTPSDTGTTSPETCALTGSKGADTRVFSRTKRRWPVRSPRMEGANTAADASGKTRRFSRPSSELTQMPAISAAPRATYRKRLPPGRNTGNS